ncbi:MAG TPA: TlpA disulfide reductase family protein [Pyrinomonadaceae bacterium]|jgi:thiol-disulfide isomerase/thioredoxin
MKEVIFNILVFVVLAFAMSSLSGCGGSASNVDSNSVPPPSPSPATTQLSVVGQEKAPSEFPPLVSTVAQSDLKNLDGSTFKIADKHGKVLLINLWATWCGPCLMEMPAFVAMQQKYGDHGFEILGLNTDDESDHMMSDINQVIHDKGINYPVVFSDDKTQAALLNISKFPGIPQSFIVDQDGNLHGVFKGANPENVKKIDEIVGGLINGQPTSEDTSSAPPPDAGSGADKKL